MNKSQFIKNLQYRSHLLLNFKNKALLTILLQFSIILFVISISDTNYIYCMTNESDNNSDLSSIFDYNEDYMEHCIGPLLEHATETFTQHNNTEDTNFLLNPMFEYLKSDDPKYIDNLSNFDNKELPEKIKTLQNAYFSESISNAVLDDALTKQTDQLYRRHEALLDSKETIKSLTQENLELKNQMVELDRLLKEALRK